MLKTHLKAIAIDSLFFYFTSMAVIVSAIVLYGLLIGIGFFVIGLLSKSTAFAIGGVFAIVATPLAFMLFVGIFAILPSTIAGIIFGLGAYFSRTIKLPKVTLLLISMGAGYVGAQYGLPAGKSEYIPSLAVIAGLVISSIVCYSKLTSKYFSYP